MNLYYDPSMMALRQLIDTAAHTVNAHNIVVDFDGEVIIDPELKYPGIDLKKFKFHKRFNAAQRLSERALQSLFTTLVSAFSPKVQMLHGRGGKKMAA